MLHQIVHPMPQSMMNGGTGPPLVPMNPDDNCLQVLYQMPYPELQHFDQDNQQPQENYLYRLHLYLLQYLDLFYSCH